MKHLWEVKHPYYCSETNYFADGRNDHGHTKHESWADYLEEFGDADLDMNLVFRWDWKKGDPDDWPEVDTLYLFHMGQRKGLFWCHEVLVNDNDEAAVREYLQPYADLMRQLWEPF